MVSEKATEQCLFQDLFLHHTGAVSGGSWSDVPDVASCLRSRAPQGRCCSGFIPAACLIHLCSPNEEQVKNLDLF